MLQGDDHHITKEWLLCTEWVCLTFVLTQGVRTCIAISPAEGVIAHRVVPHGLLCVVCSGVHVILGRGGQKVIQTFTSVRVFLEIVCRAHRGRGTVA